jgi:farnesyl-diphosphate farnesyltransferase
MRPTDIFELTSTQEAYLNSWMQRVSRSFALVVPWLEAPLNHYLATAYLLCRVVDNIEDCTQPAEWKKQCFAEAAFLLAEPQSAAEILTGWQQERWPGLTPDEQQMMNVSDGETLWHIYGSIPAESRQIIQRWVLEMIEGMSRLDAPEREPHFVERQGVQVLARETDYSQYCYVVAGTVGYMSTELVIQQYGLGDGLAERLLASCEACGRGLQKTNIVKDFAKDLRRGISYLPDEWLQEIDSAPLSLQGAPPAWSWKIVNNVLEELQEATDYLVALPYTAAGYRMASLMSLLPAYQTLLLAAQQHSTLFTPDHRVKIPRQTMIQCIQDGQTMVTDNKAVLAYSKRLEQAVKATFRSVPVNGGCVQDYWKAQGGIGGGTPPPPGPHKMSDTSANGR